MSTIETTGKTIEDAVRSGLVRLGRMKDEVDIEVLEEPKSGFFGFGSKPAKVRITEKEGVPVVPAMESQPTISVFFKYSSPYSVRIFSSSVKGTSGALPSSA